MSTEALLARGIEEPRENEDPANWTPERVSGLLRLIAKHEADAAVELGAIRAEEERVKALVAPELARLAEMRERIEEATAKRVDWLSGYCRRWFESHRPATRQSIRLPGGTISARAGVDTIDVLDAPTVLAWAMQHLTDAIVTHPPTLAKLELRKHYTRTGEVPPGSRVVPGVETVTIKAGE